eukprot:8278903-Pyramimonas_sp.AAC.1
MSCCLAPAGPKERPQRRHQLHPPPFQPVTHSSQVDLKIARDGEALGGPRWGSQDLKPTRGEGRGGTRRGPIVQSGP